MINKELYENNYILLKNFISSERALDLSKKFQEYAAERIFEEDEQVPNALASKYDFIPFVELLVEKTKEVSDLVGESVLPSYSYARIYQKDCILHGHRDRANCEISVTINLEASEIWDFWIYTSDNKKETIRLEPGDAVLYLGIKALHGRDKFEGKLCVQTFLHYVRTNGNFQQCYFDKANTYVKERKKNENFIREYKMPDAYKCQKVIEWFEKNKELQHEGITMGALLKGTGAPDKVEKDSTDISISFQKAYANSEFVAPLNFLWECVQNYMTDFVEIQKQVFESMDFNVQKYTAPHGGFHLFHHERGGVDSSRRNLVWMMYLNTVEDGGETEFKYLNTKVKPEQGKVVIWPTDFPHTHRGIPSKTEDKYILTGWYRFCG